MNDGAVDDTAPAATVGSVLGARFRVVRAIGSGGMGALFEAEHLLTGRRVAVKMLLPAIADDARAVARFMREARTASTLRHPNAVEIIDAFVTDDARPVMVMELLSGENFAARIASAGPLALNEVADVMVPVLAAIADAHARGITHRDIKPENIFLAQSADGMQPKVLDFGIAKVTRPTGAQDERAALKLTNTGAILGTPFYMSPEQVSGRSVDARSDIWSLGVVLYEALAARRPFDGDNFGQVFASILQDDVAPLDGLRIDLPDTVVTLVARCLAKNAADRPQSAGELASALVPHARISPPSRWPAPRSPHDDFETAATIQSVRPASAARAPIAPEASEPQMTESLFGTVRESRESPRRPRNTRWSIAVVVVSSIVTAGLVWRFGATRDLPRATASRPAPPTVAPNHVEAVAPVELAVGTETREPTSVPSSAADAAIPTRPMAHVRVDARPRESRVAPRASPSAQQAPPASPTPANAPTQHGVIDQI